MIDPSIIKKIVCKSYGIKQIDISQKTRKRKFVEPRQVYHYLVHLYNPKTSYRSISELTNHKTHCVSFHSIKIVRNLIETSKVFKDRIDSIKLQINEYNSNKEVENPVDTIKWQIVKDIMKCNNTLSIKRILKKQLQVI